MASSKTTTNHDEIKTWVEKRNGKPAIVAGTEKNEDAAGMLRILFSDESRGSLKPVDWDTFFDTFEQKKLAFLYQDKTKDNKESRFLKFVSR
jgi:hypothetical protein